MFCMKCGNQIPDGSAVCPNCNEPLAVQPAAPVAPAAPPQKNGGNSKIIIIAIAVVAVVAIVLGILFGTGVIGGKKDEEQDTTSASQAVKEDETKNETPEEGTQAPVQTPSSGAYSDPEVQAINAFCDSINPTVERKEDLYSGGYAIVELNAAGEIVKQTNYSADGVMTAEGWFMDEDVDASKVKFYENGILTEEGYRNANGKDILYIWYDATGDIDNYKKTAYHANGKTKSEVTYNGADIIVSDTAYDTNGKQTVSKKYTDTGEFYSHETYEYDANGNKIKQVNYKKDGSVYSQYLHTYDANGNMTESINLNSEGKETSKYTYEYNSNNKKITERYYSNGELKTYTEYSYKADGSSAGYVVYNPDGSVKSSYSY